MSTFLEPRKQLLEKQQLATSVDQLLVLFFWG